MDYGQGYEKNIMSPLYLIHTPTLGHESLVDTIESVQRQTYKNVKHVITTDTEEGHEKVNKILNSIKPKNTLHFKNPETVGNPNGVRLTVGVSYLVNYDFWQNCGTGDWIEDTHFQDVNDTFKKYKCSWVWCLRNIWDWNKELIAPDIFESIGHHVSWKNYRFIIANDCHIVPRHFMHCIANLNVIAPMYKTCNDQVIFNELRYKFPHFRCTNKYSFNFRLNQDRDLKANQTAKDWYLEGYKAMRELYPDGKYPWIFS